MSRAPLPSELFRAMPPTMSTRPSGSQTAWSADRVLRASGRPRSRSPVLGSYDLGQWPTVASVRARRRRRRARSRRAAWLPFGHPCRVDELAGRRSRSRPPGRRSRAGAGRIADHEDPAIGQPRRGLAVDASMCVIDPVAAPRPAWRGRRSPRMCRVRREAARDEHPAVVEERQRRDGRHARCHVCRSPPRSRRRVVELRRPDLVVRVATRDEDPAVLPAGRGVCWLRRRSVCHASSSRSRSGDRRGRHLPRRRRCRHRRRPAPCRWPAGRPGSGMSDCATSSRRSSIGPRLGRRSRPMASVRPGLPAATRTRPGRRAATRPRNRSAHRPCSRSHSRPSMRHSEPRSASAVSVGDGPGPPMAGSPGLVR